MRDSTTEAVLDTRWVATTRIFDSRIRPGRVRLMIPTAAPTDALGLVANAVPSPASVNQVLLTDGALCVTGAKLISSGRDAGASNRPIAVPTCDTTVDSWARSAVIALNRLLKPFEPSASTRSIRSCQSVWWNVGT